MSHPGRLDRLDLLELRISHVFEQPSAASEQDRDDRDDDLVERLLEPMVYVDAAGEPLPDTTEEFILRPGVAPVSVPFVQVERRSSLRGLSKKPWLCGPAAVLGSAGWIESSEGVGRWRWAR